MPCYNVYPTLDEALSSLMGQSLPDFEVVAVDDGSTDGTLYRLQEWANRDQRIRVLPSPHQGIIASLNAGLGVCRSDYIARMDADDRSTPNRLSQQVEMLHNHPELGIISSLVKGFPEEGLDEEFHAYIDWLNTMRTDEEIKRGMFTHSPLAHPSVAYHREWIERMEGYQDHGWAEDYDLWLRLYLAGAKFGKVPEVLLEWRNHPRRLTHTDDRYSMENNLRLKAYYLLHGPLSNCGEVIIWGTDIIAFRLGEQLLYLGCPLVAYVGSNRDHDNQSIPHVPIISPENLLERLRPNYSPALLVAENNPEKRAIISQHLSSLQKHEGFDWWLVE
jgi:glycosyltransferase involved in cell wall biosynthesis